MDLISGGSHPNSSDEMPFPLFSSENADHAIFSISFHPFGSKFPPSLIFRATFPLGHDESGEHASNLISARIFDAVRVHNLQQEFVSLEARG